MYVFSKKYIHTVSSNYKKYHVSPKIKTFLHEFVAPKTNIACSKLGN